MDDYTPTNATNTSCDDISTSAPRSNTYKSMTEIGSAQKEKSSKSIPHLNFVPSLLEAQRSFSSELERTSKDDLINDDLPKKAKCCCPHVLISDDDPFQHLYYRKLFESSIHLLNEFYEKIDLVVELFYSGEELVEKLIIMKDCECKKWPLIITDYNMGVTKLNGVMISMKLRESGFEGSIFLRTAETLDYLREMHSDFDTMLEDKQINALLDKSDPLHTKNLIQTFLKNSLFSQLI